VLRGLVMSYRFVAGKKIKTGDKNYRRWRRCFAAKLI